MAYQPLWIIQSQNILVEEPLAGGNKGVYNFPRGISPKENVIARLEFELAYNDIVVQHVNHYTSETPPLRNDLVRFVIFCFLCLMAYQTSWVI